MDAKEFIENTSIKILVNGEKVKLIPENGLADLLEDYHQSKVKNLGLFDVVESKPNEKAALNHAVSAIYFNDSSDYLTALYGVVRSLTGLEAPTEDEIKNLFKENNH